jgi:DNA-binding MarR family transcriptional regulator
MGFFMFGKQGRQVEGEEKVIEITTRGKSALLGGTVSGMEADILEVMKQGHPYTLDNLAEKLGQKRSWIKTAANGLLKKTYVEIVTPE